MRIAVFSTQQYDRDFLTCANARFGHQLAFFDFRLSAQTVEAAHGFAAVCVFVNDRLDAATMERLAQGGTRLIALRCAGFNNVDLKAAAACQLAVVRVPAYAPQSVAEFTLGLILCLRRQLHRAYARVRNGNFSLDGLLGRDLNGSTVGIVGTGRIGTALAQLLKGFGVKLLAADPVVSSQCLELGVRYVPFEALLEQSDVVSLHCPLTPQTHHLFGAAAFARMRRGAMLVNTSRGAVVDARALIDALKSRQLGAVALDVYEQEGDLFFTDLSDEVIEDDVFERLLTFPNALITAHQGFFTERALDEIARTTLANVSAFEQGTASGNEIKAEHGLATA